MPVQMRKYELEADNIVLISIIERNIEVMQRSVTLLKASLDAAGHMRPSMVESIRSTQKSIAGGREFLEKLYHEGKYPQP